ncbi:hypothetical protein V1519DRAFT_84472 [Lipomyces tetrasporus]
MQSSLLHICVAVLVCQIATIVVQPVPSACVMKFTSLPWACPLFLKLLACIHWSYWSIPISTFSMSSNPCKVLVAVNCMPVTCLYSQLKILY